MVCSTDFTEDASRDTSFTIMEADCKVLLDVGPTKPEEVTVSRKQSTHNYRWTGALLAIALCVAAAIFFTWHAKERGHTELANDLQRAVRQISENVRAAIHLEGERNDSLKTSVEWKKGVDQYHSQGGLELVNNEIVIPRKGLYFVYSQASFEVSCHTDSPTKEMVHLSHTVQRWSNSYGYHKSYQTILHSIRTACEKTPSSDPDMEGKWFNAVYMGAVFNLNKGDRLKTVMEERLLPGLDTEPGKTFFGVFAL
ncbi:tumor necrosis factor a (TNF superfamily, member 2) [Polymixia lowei]